MRTSKDHAHLSGNPLLAVYAGKLDPLGQDRRHPEHCGYALACAPRLNGLELRNEKEARARKIQRRLEQI
jgi:hypothetical protein